MTDVNIPNDEDFRQAIYREQLPKDWTVARELLTTYSGIPDDQVEAHVRKIRDEAFAIVPYPCLGLWAFLSTLSKMRGHPGYLATVARLKADPSARFLDAGTGLGQVLRLLVHDGASPSQLTATDLNMALMKKGFELFRDEDRWEASQWVAADLLAPVSADDILAARFDVIDAGSFFHLFSWEDQVRAATRIVSFLRQPTPAAANAPEVPVIWGRQLGSLKAYNHKSPRDGSLRYFHDGESFQRFWDEVGEKTGTKWRTHVQMMGQLVLPLPGFLEETQMLHFQVFRA